MMNRTFITAAALLMCSTTAAHAYKTKAEVDAICVLGHGDGYEWTGDGTGTQEDPYMCSNGTSIRFVGGHLFALSAGETATHLAPGTTLYADDERPAVVHISPEDGGGTVVIWPTAPAEAEGGIYIAWSDGPGPLLEAPFNVVRPMDGEATVDYRVEGEQVCGLDAEGHALWCADRMTGALDADALAQVWRCDAQPFDADGTGGLACILK